MEITQTFLTQYPAHIIKTGRSELRKTVMFILERDLSKVKNKTVLEIGCGDWDFAKKIMEKNGCAWYGVEPVDLKNKNLTLIKGSVVNIPYHDNSFDLVLGSQTIEHWFEYGVSIKKALKEIHRVLKPGGVLMLNAPIHKHGDPQFLSGELNKIKSMFERKAWNLLLFERVFPGEVVKGWKRISDKGFFSKVGYPDFLIPNSANARSYILNIHLQKRGEQILKPTKQRHLAIILRFMKTYLTTRIR